MQPSPMWTGTVTMTGTISMSKTDQAPAWRTNSVGRLALQTRVNAAGAQDREYTVSSSGFSVTTQGTNNFVGLAPKPTIDGRECPFVD